MTELNREKKFWDLLMMHAIKGKNKDDKYPGWESAIVGLDLVFLLRIPAQDLKTMLCMSCME